jgi:hypothetical protein
MEIRGVIVYYRLLLLVTSLLQVTGNTTLKRLIVTMFVTAAGPIDEDSQ